MIIPDMENIVYHAHPALSASGCKLLLRSPAHYAQRGKIEQTPDMLFGSAVHAAVLEPHAFPKRYVKGLDLPRRKKEDKATWEEFEAKHKGKEVLPPKEFARVLQCADAVLSHDVAGMLFDDGQAEASLFWEMNGVECKCRPDFQTTINDIPVFVDLKTTVNASRGDFEKACANFMYYLQAAFYLEGSARCGLVPEKFLFVAVEKKEPFGVMVYEADEYMLEFGREKFLHAIDIYKGCQETGNWHNYKPEILTIGLPTWAYYQ